MFHFDELSIYKWTEPWNIKGSFPESWGLRVSVSSSPLPLPLQPFFCFRSNFRPITRLETLATQANGNPPLITVPSLLTLSVTGSVSQSGSQSASQWLFQLSQPVGCLMLVRCLVRYSIIILSVIQSVIPLASQSISQLNNQSVTQSLSHSVS